MSKKHIYVLGINAYDHDASACLLRDGEIAFAIDKERITRKKHDSGFYQDVVDYCLSAAGISLDDVDLVVRNCYVLPVERVGSADGFAGRPGSDGRQGTHPGSEEPAVSVALGQGRDHVASPRPRLQRVCRLSVRRGRRDGGGRRRQLLRRRERGLSACRRQSARARSRRVITASPRPGSRR